MYDELVKELRDSAEWADRLALLMGRAEGDTHAPIMRKAADAIEELICEVADERNARLDAEERHRWIPVMEEPQLEVGDDGYNGYLVYANGYYEVADYTTDKFDNVPYFHVNGEYEPDVTHYMPLPEPPEEE